MYSQIAANKRKTVLIMLGFLLFVGALAWLVSVYFFNDPRTTWIILAVATAYTLFSYFSGSRMATALHGAREVTAKDEPRLYRTVENLAITNGLPMPKVYVMEEQGLNAFAAGRDPKHSLVAATRGLLDTLEDTELEGVMAHEMGHIKNYDVRVSVVAFALVAVIAIISDIILRSFWFRDSDNDKGGALIAVIALVAAILAPIAAMLLQLAISRRREYLADATGALTTRYPDGLANALRKIGAKGSTLKRQHTATAHLFFANPLSGKSVAKLFNTHPPIEDRIARLKDMGDEL